MHRNKVDFPQPDGPIKAIILLAGTPKEIFFKTCFEPKDKEIFFMVILLVMFQVDLQHYDCCRRYLDRK